MPKRVHDFEKYKTEFFASDHLNVYTFFKTEYDIDTAKNSHVAKEVVGWTQEKQEFLKESYQKARRQLMNKRAAEWEEMKEKLDSAELKGLEKLVRSVEKGMIDPATGKVVEFDAKDLIAILKHIRVTQGKPAEISQNLNLNRDADKDEEAKNHVADMLGENSDSL